MKVVYDSVDLIPEAFRSEYEARDGKMHLKIEGIPINYAKAEDLIAANARVVEFRTNNINLLKEVDQLRPLKEKFDGLDPDEAREAVKKMKNLGDKGIKDITDFDTKLDAKLAELLAPLKTQLATSAAETATERKRADEFLLQTQINERFLKLGGKPKAVDFIVGKAADLFEVKDRKVVAKTGQFSKEKPGDPLSIDEWLKDATVEYDFTVEPSKGAGTPQNGGNGNGPRVPAKAKPGQTILSNPTPQELGANARDIADGKVRVEYTEATA